MIRICEEARIPCVDLLPLLRRSYAQHGMKTFIPFDRSHYSRTGHTAIAEGVCDAICDRDLLKLGKQNPVTEQA